jgi:hypothetical protein
MMNRAEIILAHLRHSIRESSLMIALMGITVSTLTLLTITRIYQRLVWGLTSAPEEQDRLGHY